jgi:hypothetical protein
MAVDYPPGCDAGSAGCGFVLRLDRRLRRHCLPGFLSETIVDFNVRVLRRAGESASPSRGTFATDFYPPFSLEVGAHFPAHLAVVYPQDRNRWLVLVKGFLAIPHLIHRGDPWGELGRCGTARRLDVSLLRGLIRILAVGFRGDPRLLWHLSPGLVRPADGSEPVGVPGAGVQGGDDWAIPPFGLDSGGDDPGTALNTSVAPQDQP